MVIPRTGNQCLMKVKSHLGDLGDLQKKKLKKIKLKNKLKKLKKILRFKGLYLWFMEKK